MVAGLPVPPGKCRQITSWPSTESVRWVNRSDWPERPRAELGQAERERDQHERRCTAQTSRARPGDEVGDPAATAVPARGRPGRAVGRHRGQNAHRPPSSSSAGRKVSITSRVAAMPTRGDRAERPVGVEAGQQQAEQAQR